MPKGSFSLKLCIAILFAALAVMTVRAADEKSKGEETVVGILDGKYELTAPAGWEPKEPANNIIESEFEAPPAEGDERPGRITIMSAGGSIEQNLDRWYGQFKQPDGSDTKEAAGEPKKIEAAGTEIILVDIKGTFIDKPPRAQKGVEREGYRMLGAIVVTKDSGKSFIKFYGPEKTVGEYAEAFEEMLKNLKAKE